MRPASRLGIQVAAILIGSFVGALGTYYFHPKRPALYLYRESAPPVGLSLDAVLSAPENVVWLDARSEKAFAAGHIPEAIALNPRNFDVQMVELQHVLMNQTKHFIVYGDPSSHQDVVEVVQMLKDLGNTKVDSLRGGWKSWQAHEE